jgi:ribosomal protein S18 acetylase RimI-like enzyme
MTGRVRLVPMTAERFGAWSRHSVASFAAQQVAAGSKGASEALAYAEAQLEILLPDGMSTPGHHFWTVRSGDEDVGSLWLRVRVLPHETEAYVYDVEVVPAARGQGLGRATMLAAEGQARARGADVVRLNVFGHNAAAIGLYEGLGYTVVRAALTKELASPDRRAASSGRGPVGLREMTAEEYVAVRPRLERDRAAALSRAALVPASVARRLAAEEVSVLLPRGRQSPGHLLLTAVVGDRPVGRVWLQLEARPDGTQAVVQLLETEDGTDGDGPALVRAALAAVEEVCRARGASTVAVSVFGFDRAALGFYRDDGFRLTAQLMAKALPPG